MERLLKTGAFVLLIACSTSNPGNTELVPHLGEIHHSFVISEEAQPDFDKGLLLLHSFEYEDAREAFRKAQNKDSSEVMIYWGLAMTHYKALWGLQDVEAGRAVIAEWENVTQGEAGIGALEMDFWKGVEILYGEGELKDRNRAYAAHMEELHQNYPTNLEVAAFYALGLMWVDNYDKESLEKSAEVAAGIIKENPNHPGALHYMIHAYDNPEYAQLAINAANVYSQVAPDATHALHMPSHIYVALGMWNEVVNSNTASYGASLRRIEKKGLSGQDRGYHSMAWLHYGLLQQGRYDEAAELLREKVRYYLAEEGSDEYMINMQNQQRIESGLWPADIPIQHVDRANIGLQGKSQLHFFRSLIAFDQQDEASIEAEIDTLFHQIEAAKLLVGEDGIPVCSAGSSRFAPTKWRVTKASVVVNQMKALLAQLRGDTSKAEELFQLATQLESEVPYDPGPPFIAYPSFEQYGDWLLRQKRYEEALVQFEQSLENRTNRMRSLRGKMEALKGLGEEEKAKAVKEILDQFTDHRLAEI